MFCQPLARFICLAAAIGLCLLPASALAAPLPTPDTAGDYRDRTSHAFWVVVDPDAAGVNCRWSDAMPANWYDPGVQFPLLNVGSWSVVKTFKRNQALLANVNPAGFATLADEQNRPWLKVSIGSNNQICLVRANAAYIRPYDKS